MGHFFHAHAHAGTEHANFQKQRSCTNERVFKSRGRASFSPHPLTRQIPNKPAYIKQTRRCIWRLAKINSPMRDRARSTLTRQTSWPKYPIPIHTQTHSRIHTCTECARIISHALPCGAYTTPSTGFAGGVNAYVVSASQQQQQQQQSGLQRTF